jgi:hypothetical protein
MDGEAKQQVNCDPCERKESDRDDFSVGRLLPPGCHK